MASTKPTLVSLHAPAVERNRTPGREMRLSRERALSEYDLGVNQGLSFFRDHQGRFPVSGFAAHRRFHQAQTNDALRFEAQHHRVTGEAKPRIS